MVGPGELVMVETSDLFDDDQGYYLVRLDSLTPGGVQPFPAVKEEIRKQIGKTPGERVTVLLEARI